jgi:predicted PurR-regulated permease PerM
LLKSATIERGFSGLKPESYIPQVGLDADKVASSSESTALNSFMIDTLGSLPSWLKLWLLFPLFFLNGWLLLLLIDYLQPFIVILVLSAIFAFLLNLPAQFLQKRGVLRPWARAIVLSIALLGLGGTALTIGPLIVEQLSALVANLPQLVESGDNQLQALKNFAIAQNLPIDLTDLLNRAIDRLGSVFQLASSQLLNVLTGTISSLINILSFLVLTLFMIIGGESAWDGIFSWLPSPWNETLQESIQTTFRRYFGTQALLAGLIGMAQTLSLILFGIPYAVLFGVMIGLTTLVPYASAFTIMLVSIIVALQDFGLGVKVLIAAIAIGQVNDILISPRLMGETIGLNPIWLIAALFVGGRVGGVLGLLVAVPVASVIKSTADKLRSPISYPIERPASV